jgi:uncharacterized protein YdbL (DUF1318 family)
MSRLLSSAAVAALLGVAAPAIAQTPNVATRESTFTATVDRVERSARVVRFRTDTKDTKTLQEIYVDPTVTEFDDLQVGDVVTVRYIDSVIVQVKPDAQPSTLHDTTAAAQKAGGDKVAAQSQAVVTIDKIDGSLVSYRTADGQYRVRQVNDKQLLTGLKAGDRVEVTVTRERAVDIQRQKK